MHELEKNHEDIVFSVENHVGVITLNRSKALNALSYQMISAMHGQLLMWQDDDAVRWVLVHSSTPRAFCAGGDVRALHDMQGDLSMCERYFTEEYRLNHLTHHYAKPYVALMDGIVMGGGMGISQGASLRIVSENSRLAMPETAIGMVPDVGGSYFLSRAHDNLAIGRYLAMTGAIISAVDACRWRLADVMVAQSVWSHLVEALINCAEPSSVSLRAVAESFVRSDLHPAFESMSDFESIILSVFDVKHDVPAIIERLQALCNDDDAQGRWAANALASILYNSPVMMRLALHNQQLGRNTSLGACLRMEFDSISNALRLGEAPEGIRAKIVDKDNAPQWPSAKIESALEQLKQSPYAMNKHPLRALA